MSINHLLNQSAVTGLNLTCRKIQTISQPPQFTTALTYNITSDDLIKQRLILHPSLAGNLTFVFPSNAAFLTLLPNVGDSLQVNIKYRSNGQVYVGSINNIPALFDSTTTLINLEQSNSVGFKSVECGVYRVATGLSGLLMY